MSCFVVAEADQFIEFCGLIETAFVWKLIFLSISVILMKTVIL